MRVVQHFNGGARCRKSRFAYFSSALIDEFGYGRRHRLSSLSVVDVRTIRSFKLLVFRGTDDFLLTWDGLNYRHSREYSH